MEPNPQNNPQSIPHDSAELAMMRKDTESFGTIPKTSEAFSVVPQVSEEFGNIPNRSEALLTAPKPSERKENHTLTVREAARMFEAAGVARTERSVVNWCQINGQGMARLDAYFDPNERKYYITPQSVERAIQEEIAKAARTNELSENVGNVLKHAETPEIPVESIADTEAEKIRDLEREIIDLRITNRGKDYFIEQLRKEREGLVAQLVQSSRKVGELETRLLQLGAPTSSVEDRDA